MKMKACYFVKVDNPDILYRNEFYAVDLQILRDMGFDIEIATSAWRIPKADVYVAWWWTWAFLPLIRAGLYRRPMVVLGVFDHVMADGSLESFSHRPRWHQYLIRMVLRNADANVVCSRDQQDHLGKHFVVRGLEYCPLAVDTRLYQPASMPREKFLLMFCWMKTSNARRKCVAEAIKTMASLHKMHPDYRLIVCGEKEDGFPELDQLVHSLKAEDYIEFPGVVSKETKIELMQKCAIYLQPTCAEGFGLAILEAMSCGAPIISSPVGSVPEVVGDTGLLVDGQSPAAIGAAVNRLLADAAQREELGRCARERAVTVFPLERRRRELTALIQKLLGQSRQ